MKMNNKHMTEVENIIWDLMWKSRSFVKPEVCMLPKRKWAWAFLASKHYPSPTNQMVIDLLKQQGSWCTLALGHLRCLDGRYSIRYLAIQRDDSDKEDKYTKIL